MKPILYISVLSILIVFKTVSEVRAHSLDFSKSSCALNEMEGVWNIFLGLEDHISTGSDLAIILNSASTASVFKDDPILSDTWKEATFTAGCIDGIATLIGYVKVGECEHLISISRDDSLVSGDPSLGQKGIRITTQTDHGYESSDCEHHHSNRNNLEQTEHIGQAHGSHD